jgi:pimeloyl-ACP methyl ester carboxylesterase
MDALSPSPKVAKLYKGVPSEMWSRLHRFRTQYPYRRTMIDGTQWQYIDTGLHERVLLVLTGVPCIAEISWLSIERLAECRRVIAPDYPPLDTMAGLVDGIAGLLDREGIARADVMGGSYGGFVAQVFVRRHPNRTASLILSHTLVPGRDETEQAAQVVRWGCLLPASVLRSLFRRRLSKLIFEGQHPELALSQAHFVEIVNCRLTKAQIISMMRRVVDMAENHRFTPDDLSDWPGRILLLMADDDPATPEPAREALVAMYPQAQMHLFSGTGHAASVLKPDEYFGEIDEFLAV